MLVGGALAWAETGRVDIPLLLLSLLGALLLQAGTNLDNDVSDFQRGTDRAGRIGLPRATALGLLTTRQVRAASWGCFALATAIGLLLAWHGGWPILIAGIAQRRRPWPTRAARDRSPTRRSAISSSGCSSDWSPSVAAITCRHSR